jgi:hypothetical protein
MRLEGGPRQSLSIDDERVGSTTSSGPCVCEMERSDWLMVTFSTDVELSMTMVPHVRTCIVPVIDPLKAQLCASVLLDDVGEGNLKDPFSSYRKCWLHYSTVTANWLSRSEQENTRTQLCYNTGQCFYSVLSCCELQYDMDNAGVGNEYVPQNGSCTKSQINQEYEVLTTHLDQ